MVIGKVIKNRFISFDQGKPADRSGVGDWLKAPR